MPRMKFIPEVIDRICAEVTRDGHIAASVVRDAYARWESGAEVERLSITERALFHYFDEVQRKIEGS